MKLRPDCTEISCGVSQGVGSDIVCSKCGKKCVMVVWEETGSYTMAKETFEDIKMEIENDKFIFGTGGKI